MFAPDSPRSPVSPEYARRDRAARVPWGWRDVIVAILLSAVVFGLGVGVLAVLHAPVRALERTLAHAGLSSHVFALAVSSLVLYAAAAAGIAGGIVRPRRASWLDLGYRPVSLGRLALVLPAYVATLTTAGAVMVVWTGLFVHGRFVNPQVQEIAGGVTRTAPNVVTLLIVTAVLAPIAEETVFRGVLYQTLRRSLPVWVAVITSALIFAAAHAIPIIFPWLFVTGVALALIFEYGQSLYCSMLLHGLINGVNVFLLLQTLPRH